MSDTPSETPGERIFVGLGSNLGDREENLRAALKRLEEARGVTVVRVSRFHETEPWGVKEQPWYLNAVAELRSDLEPEELLDTFKRIEREMGRVPSYRWGPRLIDLDLLLYGWRALRTPRVTLPHPHILERPFVLEPLREIAPEVVEELRDAAVPLRSPGPDG